MEPGAAFFTPLWLAQNFTNQISVNQRMEDHKPETLVELLKQSAEARPDREALRFKQNKSWVSMTAEALLARVRNVTLGLYQLGIHKSDRVAILAESGPLWTITDYAVLANRAVNVPIYPTQPPHQVEYILRESEPGLLFVSTARQMKRVDAALRKFPDLRIISFQAIEGAENVTTFDALEAEGAKLATERPELFALISSDVQPSDLA